MNRYKSSSFIKLFIRFFLVFLIVFTVAKMLISIVRLEGIQPMMDQYFSSETWVQFAKMQFVLSGIYGLFMAGYYKFIKK